MNVIQTMEAIQHVKGNNHYFQLYVYVKMVVLTLKNIFLEKQLKIQIVHDK